jgi:hypothetical protein
MHMDQLTTLERAALENLLAGELPALDVLRAQIRLGRVSARRMTGVGFFTTFALPADAPRVQGSFRLGDVFATIDGLRHGVGFVLWVKGGVLDMLEGYTFDESWPAVIDGFTLEYIDQRERDLRELRG